MDISRVRLANCDCVREEVLLGETLYLDRERPDALCEG